MLDRLKSYIANLFIIWFAILLYFSNDYYVNFLLSETRTTLLCLALAYTIIGVPYYILKKNASHSKGRSLFIVFKSYVLELIKYLHTFTKDTKKSMPKLSFKDKTHFMFLLVKFFFLPIMLNFFFSNLHNLNGQWDRLITWELYSTIQGFNLAIYPVLITFIFFIDTAIFSFGYAFEAKFLKNQIRSVEPTTFGWLVAILSYPPFNNVLGLYLLWYANEMSKFSNDYFTFAIRITIVLLFLIYLAASIALGPKASNLTNRGIVSRFPYSIVRHPAYITKNLAWWLMVLPVLSWQAVLGTFLWSLVYYFRAITEERHLINDPDYQKYVKKVKYRFIPGLY